MPHFYFHIFNQEEQFQDNIGAELADISAAHQRALRLINRVMLCAELASKPTPERWSRWAVRVVDANGHSILSVLFPRVRTQAVHRTRLSVIRRASA
jgi:Domain of unknown function (DUF6894)